MGIHLKDNELDNIVSGTTDNTDIKRAEAHLRECATCSEKVRILSMIVDKREPDALPGPHVRAAVISEWHNINSKRNQSAKFYLSPFKMALGVAASVIIAITVYIGITDIPFPSKQRDFSVAETSGEVLVNGTIAGNGEIIQEGYTVVTADNGHAVIKSDNYLLKIEGSSEIRLASNKKMTGFDFVLYRGSIVSRSFINLQYSFTCGEYRVSPIGTEFRLEYIHGIVKVAVSSGEVTVSGKGFDTRVLPGAIWSSDGERIAVESKDSVKENKKTADVKHDSRSDDSAESEDESSEKTSGKSDRLQNKDDIRDLKKETRKEIREIKNEKRRERQFRGGN